MARANNANKSNKPSPASDPAANGPKRTGPIFAAKPASAGWSGAINAELVANIAELRRVFDKCSDFVIREFHASGMNRDAVVAYIDGLVKHEFIMDNVLKPLIVYSHEGDADGIDSLEKVNARALLASGTKLLYTGDDALDALLHGDSLLMIDGMAGGISISVRGWERRNISEPQTETVVFGPREGFTETIRVNTALLRRRIYTNDLRMETMTIGSRTQTPVAISYLSEIADPEIVEDVKRRLSSVDVDSIENSGALIEYIESEPASLFETVSYTEKPDVVAAQLLEGRVAILVDGSPFALIVPTLFVECFQTAEDYSVRTYYATFLRIIRLIAFFVSLIAPAAYVALASRHQELIPNALLFTMAASSEGLPFPSFIETALMLVIFEILKEAGIRLPKPVGQAISIVGALVMGQAAIQAGLVGAPVVIVIALTAVASFAIPMLSNTLTLLRWFMLVMAEVFGGYGITLGLLAIFVHLASLKSFGVLYMNPIAPIRVSDLKDALIRAPLWSMKYRPVSLHPLDSARQNSRKPDFEKNE
ncbi:MAG: spore germination protein [Oscillospiraceae bacterium]|jgi:spore germination protein KA|nr:spore germination protein [Oscillospiraceae bacterium]